MINKTNMFAAIALLVLGSNALAGQSVNCIDETNPAHFCEVTYDEGKQILSVQGEEGQWKSDYKNEWLVNDSVSNGSCLQQRVRILKITTGVLNKIEVAGPPYYSMNCK